MVSNENFPRLVQLYKDTIFRLAYSYTKNHFDADDVTQNVLLQLYKTDKAFKSEAHLKNWLVRITVNQCKNLFRAPWRKHENLEDYVNTIAFEEEDQKDLFYLVMDLDRKYRVTLMECELPKADAEMAVYQTQVRSKADCDAFAENFKKIINTEYTTIS